MVKNIVVISDTHFGCKLAICPPKVILDEGGIYKQSNAQKVIWSHWQYFWNDFVPSVCGNDDFIVVHNGDVIDGVHHNSTTQITHNIKDQENIAVEVLSKIKENNRCKGIYLIRGTEAHSGVSAESEERIGERIKAVKINGNYTHYELWLRFGYLKSLVHFSHHIGNTNSASYKATAVLKELIESYVEAGKNKTESPDVIVRSHRHYYIQVIEHSKKVNAISLTTPSWQLKTPFSYKNLLGRTALPQIGGIIIREGDEVPIYVRTCIKNVCQSKQIIVV